MTLISLKFGSSIITTTMEKLLTVPLIMMLAKFVAHVALAIHLLGHLVK